MNQPHSNGSQRVKVVRINGSVSFGDFTHVSHNHRAIQALSTWLSTVSCLCKLDSLAVMAYVHEAAPVVAEAMEESPTYTPVLSPETVHSSSTEGTAQSLDLAKLSATEAFELLMQDEEMPEMSASATCDWWKAGEKMEVYQLLAPAWVDAVRHHACIHCYSATPDTENEEGYTTIYLHSSKQNATRLLKEGDLKQRFLFTSAIQCSLHRVAHDHFGLSNAKI
eukprot:3481577-Amphidinium_carterae.1